MPDEPEGQGTGTIQDDQGSVSTPATDAPPPVAGDDAPAAAPPEDAPAGGDGEDAGPDGAPELSDEDWAAIAVAHKDKLLPHLGEDIEREAQSRADRQLRELERDPSRDPEFARLVQERAQALQASQAYSERAASLARRIQAGEDIDPKDFHEASAAAVLHAQRARELTEAAYEGATFHTLRTTAEEFLRDDLDLVVEPAGSDGPMPVKEAIARITTAYRRLAQSGDAANRERAVPYALGWFFQLGRDVGRVTAEKKAAEKYKREQAARDHLTRTNVTRELAAKAGARSPAGGNGHGPAPDTMTYEELMKLPAAEIERFRQTNRGRYRQLLGIDE